MADYSSVKVVRIELGEPGAKPEKVSGGGYAWPVRYVLENGEVVETHTSKRLFRDAKAEVASLPKEPENPTEARFVDGRFVGTSVRFYIGPKREVAS